MTEEVLVSLGNIDLTKNFVSYSKKTWGFQLSQYIFLKDISSVEFIYKSHLIFILLSFVSLIIAIVAVANESFGDYYNAVIWNIAFVLAIIFIILFFVTRKHAILITSHGGTKIVQVINDEEKTQNFVEEIIKLKKEEIR